MSLELSLYTIEGDLPVLIQMRDEALEAVSEVRNLVGSDGEATLEALRELKVIEDQIAAYIKAEVRKCDSIAHVWRTIEAAAVAKRKEARRLEAAADADEARLKHLKANVQAAMESFEWRAGKPRVIEGKTAKLYLKNNGGKQAVEVRDDSMIPDEFCNVTVTMQAPLWRTIQQYNDLIPGLFNEKRQPVLTAIAAELDAPCQKCNGEKLMFDPSCPGPKIDEHSIIDCDGCGGSGHRGVPGAVLLPRGQHVEIR